MRKILSLEALDCARRNKMSVIVPGHGAFGVRPYPAAFIINQPGSVLLLLFGKGMFVYEKGKKS